MKRFFLVMLCGMFQSSMTMVDDYPGSDDSETREFEQRKKSGKLSMTHDVPPLQYLAAEKVYALYAGEKRTQAEQILPAHLFTFSRDNPLPFVDYVHYASSTLPNAVEANDTTAFAMMLPKYKENTDNEKFGYILNEALCNDKPAIVAWVFEHVKDLTPDQLEKMVKIKYTVGFEDTYDRMVSPRALQCWMQAYASSIIDEGVRARAKELWEKAGQESISLRRCIDYLKTGVLGERGVDTAPVIPQIHTSLHEACLSSKALVVRNLLLHDADPNKQNDFGQTPLHYVAGQYIPNEILLVQLLLVYGANPCITDQDGKTAFGRAHNDELRSLLRRAEAEWRSSHPESAVSNGKTCSVM